MAELVRVVGLAEFQRALRKLDAEAVKGLRLAANRSAEFLIDKVKPKVPRRSGRAAASLKPRSTRTAVRIAAGGPRAPHYPWLDFGGGVGPGKRSRRPFYSDGRYLYPTYHENKPQFQRILEAAIVEVAESAGLEVD